MFPRRELRVFMNVFHLLLTVISEVPIRHEQKQNSHLAKETQKNIWLNRRYVFAVFNHLYTNSYCH